MSTPGVVRAADISAALGLPPPTAEQVAVIEAPAAAQLVVAGAGSGKTETMAARVVWLVANGQVDPDQVLGLTFTRKAAAELSERIARRLRGLRTAGLWTPRLDDGTGAEVLGGTPTVSTYHAYAGRLVREHALRVGVEPESRLLSQAAAWQYAAEVVARYDGPMDEVGWAESTVITAVVEIAGELAEHLLTPEEMARYVDQVLADLAAVPPGEGRRSAHPMRKVSEALAARRALLPMVRGYLELKRSRDALDFADQMALAARLARDVPRVGVGERVRFRAVLLDEFQDTSEAQLVLLRSLFGAGAGTRLGAGPEAGADNVVSVTAVGDPHQSIYGWRGASATTIARFPAEFGTGGRAGAAGAVDGAGVAAAVRPLRTSWRNDLAILDVANLVSAPLRRTARVPVPDLVARPDASAGAVSVARAVTVEDEASAIASWVRDRWASPSGRRTGASAAVICRKRSQFPLVVEALRERGLPVEVVGLGGLLLTPEVADLVALLWTVADPARGDQLMRLLTGPPVALGAADLDGLHAWTRVLGRRAASAAPTGAGATAGPAGRRTVDLAPDSVVEVSLAEAVESLPPPGWVGPGGERLSPAARDRLARLAESVATVRSVVGVGLADLVVAAERALGLDVEVAARPEHGPASARAHLDAFADTAADFAASADRPTLNGFLAWLAAAVDQERGLDSPRLESSTDAVQVLTAHAAKGLEWDVVAVPGLVEGVFPAREHGVTSRWDGAAWVVAAPTDRGWTLGASGVPYPLRGDADGLPRLRTDAVDYTDLAAAYEQFMADAGAHELAEEQRLMYVAVTRARHELLLTAAVWGDPLTPRVSVPLLDELRRRGVATFEWAELPAPVDGVAPANPRLVERPTVLWPGPRVARPGVEAAAAAVVHAADAEAAPTRPTWERAMVLLADQAARQIPAPPRALLGPHLSTAALVRLARDPQRFARALRRPMPTPTAVSTRRGTAFHAWVEQHYGRGALVEWDELPGAADSDAAEDVELAELQERFLASPWADRTPLALELSVETVVAGVAVRGRIDAVFPRPGGVILVDWKTGTPPQGDAARVAALQLGAYALAYRRLTGLTDGEVSAAFYYARTGMTQPVDLPDEAQLAAVLEALPVERDGVTARP